MQGKRDQLHAHQFVVGRLVSALVMGEPDAVQTPMRRTTVGAVFGVLLAVVVAAGFAVFGMVVRGGNTSWREPGSIIVEQETGSRYLFLDDTLRPVLNYASARLAAGGGKATVRTVSKSSLDGVRHGLPVGIPDAPDALPESGRLARDPWLVCAVPAGVAGGPARPRIAVSIGRNWPAEPVPDNRGVLVRTTDGDNHLVARDRRMRVSNPAVLAALGYGSARPVTVDPAWLNALTAGAELAPPSVPGRGQAGPALDGSSTRVGQLFELAMASGAKEHYLMRTDGLAPLSRTELALLLADSGTAAAYQGQPVRPLPLTPAVLAQAPRSAESSTTAGLPATPPDAATGVADDGRALCVELSFAAGREASARLVTVDTRQLDPVPAATSGDSRAAGQVRVAADSGALVTAQPAPGTPGGTKYLVTDVGMKFPLPSDEVAAALGYGDVAAVAVPTTLLAFLPTGPALDPVAARTELRKPR